MEVEKNNNQLTPKGYNSYEIFNVADESGAYTKVNMLVKKSWWARYYWRILLVVFICLTAYKIYRGDFQF